MCEKLLKLCTSKYFTFSGYPFIKEKKIKQSKIIYKKEREREKAMHLLNGFNFRKNCKKLRKKESEG